MIGSLVTRFFQPTCDTLEINIYFYCLFLLLLPCKELHRAFRFQSRVSAWQQHFTHGTDIELTATGTEALEGATLPVLERHCARYVRPRGRAGTSFPSAGRDLTQKSAAGVRHRRAISGSEGAFRVTPPDGLVSVGSPSPPPSLSTLLSLSSRPSFRVEGCR